MSFNLMLKASCDGCRSTVDLYGSNCKHMTLCVNCGKTMAGMKHTCRDCGTTITRLIREYNVRASSSSDKNYFIGRFMTGLPRFSKKKNDNKWSLQKEGLQGRQVTDTIREKYKNKPWLLEDETGQFRFQGVLEGAQTSTYYLLMLQGKEFVAIPTGSWYNFNKVAQYKQLTLEEAEEKIKNRRKTADGYHRWMMKAANNGAAAFGEVERIGDKESGGAGGRGRKKNVNDDDVANVSDRGEEDEDEDEASALKNRLGLNQRGGDDDDEEGPRGGDLDFDDDDIEKGDDWEHEEIFTDDDEAVGNHPEEREDLAPEIPAPPEIKQDEEDEEENEEDEGGLSQSGKELKKLLGKNNNGYNESGPEQYGDDDDADDDIEDESSPALARKPNNASSKRNNQPKDKLADNSAARGTPSSSKTAKGKRKNNDEAETSNGPVSKKVKTEYEPVSAAKINTPANGEPSTTPAVSSSTVLATEDEIRAVLLQQGRVTTHDLVAEFKPRLRSNEDKRAFSDILKKFCKIQKTNGVSYVVLKDN
ncbi:transcription initiation factor IIF subunit alpha-like [Rutidosis leptorrhynchoides]|uniref:transcription initiation factor IIF subunit alpha-like n=1 Tax=Rutidosis leptorrhynchoides TaxID=125765 RepID=UPI003A996383